MAYTTPTLKIAAITALAKNIFDGEVLNRAKLAQIVFNDKEQLAKLNAIVHPAVKLDFDDWVKPEDMVGGLK